MKRCVFGVSLLILLLFLCFGVQKLSARAPEEIADLLSEAGQSALKGDWDAVQAQTAAGRRIWYRTRPLQTWLRHEELLQEIDTLFSQLEVLIPARQGWACAQVCMSIRARTAALGGRCPGTGR